MDFISVLCFVEPLEGESLAIYFTLVRFTGWLVGVFGLLELVTEVIAW